MTDLFCDAEPDIEEARIVSYIEIGIRREAYRLHRKNSRIKQNELLILDKPVYGDDTCDNILIPLDIVPSGDTMDDLIDELSFEQMLLILNKYERMIVRLTIKKGIPQKQIAGILGMSQKTVSKYKRKAYDKLKEYVLHDKEMIKMNYN